MANPLLNPRTAPHSRALSDRKQAHLDRIHFLVANHTVRETVIVHQQASGANFSIAKCIKRATLHDNTGNTSIRSLPWPHDGTAIRRSKPRLFLVGINDRSLCLALSSGQEGLPGTRRSKHLKKTYRPYRIYDV